MSKKIDTLIVINNGKYVLEKFDSQDLDNYDYITECNHEDLLNCKILKYYYMETITINDIMTYNKKFEK